jgi:RNA polymerase-binding transcription factor DksA
VNRVDADGAATPEGFDDSAQADDTDEAAATEGFDNSAQADDTEGATPSEGFKDTAQVADTDGDLRDVLETLDVVERELSEVDRALARLEDGSYGFCEVCSTAIDEHVLEQHPTERWCASHLPLAVN